MTARVSMLLKSRPSLDMLPFSVCNKKKLAIRHTNRPPLSNDTIDSVLRHREVGRAKDLSAPPRNCKYSSAGRETSNKHSVNPQATGLNFTCHLIILKALALKLSAAIFHQKRFLQRLLKILRGTSFVVSIVLIIIIVVTFCSIFRVT